MPFAALKCRIASSGAECRAVGKREALLCRTQWRFGNDKLTLGAYSYESTRMELSGATYEDIARPLYSAKRKVFVYAEN